jgi:hypothetical protein
MKGALMRATMLDLTVEASFSRPRVSIDNAYAEALFRRAKHCPTWPERPFDTSEEARLAKSARWSREIRNWHWAGTDLSKSRKNRGVSDPIQSSRVAVHPTTPFGARPRKRIPCVGVSNTGSIGLSGFHRPTHYTRWVFGFFPNRIRPKSSMVVVGHIPPCSPATRTSRHS